MSITTSAFLRKTFLVLLRRQIAKGISWPLLIEEYNVFINFLINGLFASNMEVHSVSD